MKKTRRDRNFTRLKDHKLNKKLLSTRASGLNLNFLSWINDRLPEMLWAILLAENLPRDEYLQVYRAISDKGTFHSHPSIGLTHSELETLSSEAFQSIFSCFLSDSNILKALTPLNLFSDLPGRKNWREWLPTSNEEDDWANLANSIGSSLHHQSEISTDVRWLKVRFLINQGRLHFPPDMKDQVDELLDFPNSGDLRHVRPSVRALELTIGTLSTAASGWSTQFWTECLKRTECLSGSEGIQTTDFPHNEVNKVWAKVYVACVQHCSQTRITTMVDAKHDGVFGLALFGLSLVASAFRPYSTRPPGRLILRSLVEVYITLAYLVKKDEVRLWQVYRKHGNGQAKLAFLKLYELDELPEYVNIETLEILANEDAWQEFQDIDLGQWANKDLRRMSQEIGIKEIYDKYYNWPSAFVHAQWPAVRNTVFELCGNPLHRLHRIPRLPRLDLEDVSWDCIKVGNLILDLVNEAYPPFKSRLRLPTGLCEQ